MVEERRRRQRAFAASGRVEEMRQRAFAVSGRGEEETENVRCQW